MKVKNFLKATGNRVRLEVYILPEKDLVTTVTNKTIISKDILKAEIAAIMPKDERTIELYILKQRNIKTIDMNL
nr:hypothetical protein [uncultured Anaerostipes sp.]